MKYWKYLRLLPMAGLLALCAASVQAVTVSQTLAVLFSSGSPPSSADKPGPSLALFNSSYYTCSQNFYVATNGSNANNGTSAGTPWLTIAHADTVSRTGGDCINVAAGTYSDFNGSLTHGGTTAASNGYVTYRCVTPSFASGSGCIINTNGGQTVCTGNNCGGGHANYIIVDGFDFIGTASDGSSFGAGISNGNSGTTAAAHHWFVLNSTFTGYGQGGIQMQDSDYFFSSHNTFIHNALAGCVAGFQGSGLSYVVPKPVSGYTPTADDTNANNNAALNMMGIQGPSFPFKLGVTWSVAYTNNIGCTSPNGASDGNGYIMDSFTTRNGNTLNYPNQALVAFNISYNNGGGGFVSFATDNVTYSNNSCYNNWENIWDSGTSRKCIQLNDANGGLVENNIAVAVPTSSGITDCNGAIFGGPTNSSSPATTFKNNITKLQGVGTASCPQGGAGGEIEIYVQDVYNTPPNKTLGTDPQWVNVGRTSTGDQNTAPVGANFALCAANGSPAGCTAASPAISFGATETYLSSQSVDAGACYHTLTTCP